PMPKIGPPIPRIIHRFWTGGQMNQSDFCSVLALQERLNKQNKSTPNLPWSQILWTSPLVNSYVNSTILQQQLKTLNSEACLIESADQLCQNEKLEEFEKLKLLCTAQSKNDLYSIIPTLKYFSDKIRMLALFKMGGTYMDVDIGPGEEMFNQDLYHRAFYNSKNDEHGYWPLLGSMFGIIIFQVFHVIQ
ncbi:MAG: glycosyltransferase, partial [Bacteroidales bacterium]